MAIYNVHGGHSLVCRGASGYLDEVNEDRKVKNKVIELLRNAGHTVYDCTDDVGSTASGNLKNIVDKCNAHKVDLDVSIHLNAGGGTGCEVWVYSNKTEPVASRVSSKVSSALGIRNRGVKTSTGLYVLKHTNSPAILVECCFVDSTTDKNNWDVSKCAKAIVEGILNASVKTTTTSNSQPSKPANNTEFKVNVNISNLNIRKGPSVGSATTGHFTGKGTFTIVETKSGPGSSQGWGRLKSGAGWISLDYAKRI